MKNKPIPLLGCSSKQRKVSGLGSQGHGEGCDFSSRHAEPTVTLTSRVRLDINAQLCPASELSGEIAQPKPGHLQKSPAWTGQRPTEEGQGWVKGSGSWHTPWVYLAYPEPSIHPALTATLTKMAAREQGNKRLGVHAKVFFGVRL